MPRLFNQSIGHFQNEAKCKTFLVKMSLICVRIKNYDFHINGSSLSLALKQRLWETRKRPMAYKSHGWAILESNMVVWFVVPFIIGEIEGINGLRSIY